MTPAEVRLAQLLRGQGRWPTDGESAEFLELARRHGVSELLHEALQSNAAPPPPEAARAALRDSALRAAAIELARRSELQHVLARMHDAGVKAILIKGTPLAYTHYPRAALRHRADTDVLIRPEQRAPLLELLAAEGYRPAENTGAQLASAEISCWKDGSPLALDVHWRINNSPLLATALTFDELQAQAAAVPALGPHARAPGPVDAVLLAALHRASHHQAPFYASGVAHRGDRLIWLYDLHLLAPALTGAQLAELARRAAQRRVAGLCLDALHATREAFGTPLPATLLESLTTAATRPEPSMAFLRGGRRALLLAELRALRAWPERWQLLREHALPPGDYMLRKYGTQRRWLLPALYLRRAFGWLAR